MLIHTITSYRFVISDLENTDGSELVVARLRKRIEELKSNHRTEIEFELVELNRDVARHPSQINNGEQRRLLTIDDI